MASSDAADRVLAKDNWANMTPRQNSSRLLATARASHDRHMLRVLIVIGRGLALGLRGHRELVYAIGMARMRPIPEPAKTL
jgi:hypothetical protein